MRVLVDAVWPREYIEDAVQVDDGSEENADAWVVDEEHERMGDPVVAIPIQGGINHTLDQLFEAADLGSPPRSLVTHED